VCAVADVAKVVVVASINVEEKEWQEGRQRGE
jgi:hypothetical protein